MKTVQSSLLIAVGLAGAACEPSITVEGNGAMHSSCLEAGPAESREELIGGSTTETSLDAAINACLDHYASGPDRGDSCASNSWCPALCEEDALIGQDTVACIAEAEGLSSPHRTELVFSSVPDTDVLVSERLVWLVEDGAGERVIIDARTGVILTRGATSDASG